MSNNFGCSCGNNRCRNDRRNERREDMNDWRDERREDRRDWRDERREDRHNWRDERRNHSCNRCNRNNNWPWR